MRDLIRRSAANVIVTLWILSPVFAQGSIVTVFLKDSSRINGELIGVHNSVVILLPITNTNKVEQIAVPNDRIVSVFLAGSSRIPEAIVIGAFLGSAAGALTEQGLKNSLGTIDGDAIGGTSEDFYSKAGFAMGAGLGWLVGWAASQPDKSFDLRLPDERASLGTYARHASTPDSSEHRKWHQILQRVLQ